MSAHTPGPWFEATNDLEGTEDFGLTILSNDKVICDLYQNMGSHLDRFKNDAANARLIAAAPDMLAALQDILDSGANSYRNGDKHDDIVIARLTYESARAAIAQATGAA